MTTHLTVVSKSSVVEIRDEREFDLFCGENPAAQDPKLLFRLRSGIPEQLLSNFYGKYPDSRGPRIMPFGVKGYDSGEATLDLSASMQVLDCYCDQCATGGDCRDSPTVDVEIPALVASKGERHIGVIGQLPRNLTIDRSQPLRMPELSSQQAAGIKLEGGRLTLEYEGSPAISFSRRVVKLRILPKRAGLHTFGMGIIPHEKPKEIPAMYIAAELREICKTWDLLLGYFKGFLSVANREILNEGAGIDRDLIRKLAKTADVCEELLMVHQKQYGSWKLLIGENKRWFNSRVNSGENSGSGESAVFSSMMDALEMLGKSGKEISDDLVVKTDKLIERTHNLMSIDEAYKTRRQNASIKRLTWITFIFLPLLFVSSLFGMNVDLLRNNPSWTTYFYLAIPMLLLVMLAVLWLKRKELSSKFRGSLSTVFRVRTTENQNYSADLEMQSNAGRLETVRTAGSHEVFLWAAEHGHVAILELEIFKGANIEHRSREGSTALQLAAGSGHGGVLECLLRHGAEVNAPALGAEGRTALQAASAGGHMAIVRRLLLEGAKITVEDYVIELE